MRMSRSTGPPKGRSSRSSDGVICPGPSMIAAGMPIARDHEAKSIGQEQTFGQDVADREHVQGILFGQVQQVGRRLRKHGLRARGISLKIRFGDFETISRSGTLADPSDLTDELWEAARGLFDHWADSHFVPVRLIGVAADRLENGGGQLDLFTDPKRQKRRGVDRAMDAIQAKFGAGSVKRGGG